MKKYFFVGILLASVSLPLTSSAVDLQPTNNNCDPSNALSCGVGQICDSASKTCVASSNNLNQLTSGDSGFVPITNIPGLTNISQCSGTGQVSCVSVFLGNLYTFLIGIAAILAVIQIVRGGIMIMTRESMLKHGEGHELIAQAILGLVLILAPVLVFTIINPEILKFGLFPAGSQINLATSTASTTGAPTPTSNGQPVGVYLQKLTTSDNTAQQNFINSCQSPSVLINSCPTVNSQTSQPNCSGATTLECQKYASSQSTWLVFGPSDPTWEQRLVYAASATTLIPAVTAEVSGDTQFITQCTADGGKVCTTDSHVEVSSLVGGDYVSCPSASQQPTYSQPANTEAYCFKLPLFCAEPSNSANGCSGYWNFQTHQ